MESWGKELMGVSHPCPWEQITVVDYDDIPDKEASSTMVTICSKEIRTHLSEFKFVHGPYPPYFGSSTKVKSQKKETKLVNPGPFLKCLNELLQLRSWAKKERSNDLISLCNSLLEEKYRLLDEGNREKWEDLIASSNEVYGGNIEHRLRATTEKTGALINTIPTIATHVKTSTSSLAELSKGGEDYNIHFQQAFLYIQTIICDEVLNKEEGEKIPPMYGSFFDCEGCTHVLELDEFTIPKKNLKRLVKEIKRATKSSIVPLTGETSISLEIDTGWPDSEIVDNLTLHVAVEVANKIHQEFFSHFAEKIFVGKVVQQESYSSINLNEIRSLNPREFFTYLLMTSRYLRDSVRNLLRNNIIPFDYSPFCLLASLYLTTSLLDEILMSFNVRPTTYFQTTNNTAAADLIKQCFINLLNEMGDQFLYYFTRGMAKYDIFDSSKDLSKWFVSYLRFRVNSFDGDEKDKQDALITISINTTKLSFPGVNLNVRAVDEMIYAYKRLFYPEATYIRSLCSKVRRKGEEDLETSRILWRRRKCPSQFNDVDVPKRQLPLHLNVIPLVSPLHPPNIGLSITSFALVKKGEPLWSDAILRIAKYSARPFGILNSNINDILCLLIAYQQCTTISDDHKQKLHGCLADGSGTNLAMMKHLFPQNIFFFNTSMDHRAEH